jgi:hypothetical protein
MVGAKPVELAVDELRDADAGGATALAIGWVHGQEIHALLLPTW